VVTDRMSIVGVGVSRRLSGGLSPPSAGQPAEVQGGECGEASHEASNRLSALC
jgi:hypothetical protein